MRSCSTKARVRSAPIDAEPLSIVLLARSLEPGGTEQQLVELAIGLRHRGHRVWVVVFYGGGALAARLERAGISVVDLRKSGRWDFARFLVRTARALRRMRPDVVYSFLGGANVVAALTRPFVSDAKLIWSVRNSAFDPSIDHWPGRAGHRLEAALARRPDVIVSNSSAGYDFAISRGFPAEKIRVVPNGIDTSRFRHVAALRREQRRTLGFNEEDVVVGVLARLNSTKDYPTFLRAAAQIAALEPTARFLCVGSGPELGALHMLIGELGIAERVTFAGELKPEAALNAFDIACSSSITEGFSNAIAEAMACGLPCVVTNVGDSAAIVGDTGTVVPPSSPAALANAIQQRMRDLDEHDPRKPRQRIIDQFSVAAMVDRTIEVFRVS